MNRRHLFALCLGALLPSSFALRALAVATQSFVVESSSAFRQGTPDGVAIHSDGRVTTSLALSRTPLDEALTAYCALRGRDGSIFIGTGTEGVIYRANGSSVEVFARTNQLLVTSLAFDAAGTLYAGTLPEGRIYAIDPRGSVRELVKLERADHIWDLVWDARRSRLLAATGPDARVHSIDVSSRRVELLYDGDDSHVMALALGDDGTIFAGTTERALVLAITPSATRVLLDAPGNEITSLAFRDGSLFVAANEFQAATASAPPTNPRAAPLVGHSRPRPGKAKLFRIERDGSSERIFEDDDAHITELEAAPNGVVYAASGKDGRVLRIDRERRHSVYLDVDERQVLALGLTAEQPFLVTGDGAALYRRNPRPEASASWTSAVFDAGNRASFGAVSLRSTGALEWSTRSGDVDPPDSTWSQWSSFRSGERRSESPDGRYLQVKVRFPANASAELRGVRAYYRAQNQRPVILAVNEVVDASQATQRRRGRLAPTSMIRISWRVDNPDGDELRYRLKVQRDGESSMRELLRGDVIHTATVYDWDTSGLPDGHYRVIVEASDELANPESSALRSVAASDLLVVDNHAPRIEGLAIRGGAIIGRVVDALGPVSRLEIAVDGAPYADLEAEDRLLDSAEESFLFSVASFRPGPHAVAIRATDATGHQAVSEILVTR